MGRIAEFYFTAEDLAAGKKAVEAAQDVVNKRTKSDKTDSLSLR
jgi:hypothetical protein